jgi:hypothetical protein
MLDTKGSNGGKAARRERKAERFKGGKAKAEDSRFKGKSDGD